MKSEAFLSTASLLQVCTSCERDLRYKLLQLTVYRNLSEVFSLMPLLNHNLVEVFDGLSLFLVFSGLQCMDC